jgi:hypothetical protein
VNVFTNLATITTSIVHRTFATLNKLALRTASILSGPRVALLPLVNYAIATLWRGVEGRSVDTPLKASPTIGQVAIELKECVHGLHAAGREGVREKVVLVVAHHKAA